MPADIVGGIGVFSLKPVKAHCDKAASVLRWWTTRNRLLWGLVRSAQIHSILGYEPKYVAQACKHGPLVITNRNALQSLATSQTCKHIKVYSNTLGAPQQYSKPMDVDKMITVVSCHWVGRPDIYSILTPGRFWWSKPTAPWTEDSPSAASSAASSRLTRGTKAGPS